MSFPDTKVGILDKVKVFLQNVNANKSPFAGVTKLQGFDGTAYVDILTFDNNIHEGWNTFKFPADKKPTYFKYKWSGGYTGCRFGEVKYYGVVVTNDNNPSVTCTPMLKLGTTVTDLSNVIYSESATPKVSTIEPRYGTVVGGE